MAICTRTGTPLFFGFWWELFIVGFTWVGGFKKTLWSFVSKGFKKKLFPSWSKSSWLECQDTGGARRTWAIMVKTTKVFSERGL